MFYLLLAALISMFSHVYVVKNYDVELEINFTKINFMMLLKLKLKDQGLKLIFLKKLNLFMHLLLKCHENIQFGP